MKPTIVYVSGAPGSGKTTLAKLLSEQLYIPYISSDLIHGGIELTEPDHDRKSTIEDVFISLMVGMAQKSISFVVDHALQKELAKTTIIDKLQNVANVVYVHVQCSDPIARYSNRVKTSTVPDIVRRRDLLLERAEWHEKNLDSTAAPLSLGLPTIVVNTDNGYNPGFNKIIDFIKEQIGMQTIRFQAEDGLTITADQYLIDEPKGTILLCHRSHFNRGEYREIAPRLNKLGYNCLAIDQRSGMKVLGTVNETYKLAKEQGKATGYLEAKQDIQAAINYAYSLNNQRPIVLIGSSYSASLSLLLAAEDDMKLAAIVAFSPGEYLKGVVLTDLISKIRKPTLVLSARKEISETSQLLARSDKHFVEQYKPKTEGGHGARVLWVKTEGNEEYWVVLEGFLKAHLDS